MPDGTDDAKLAFEREKWADDVRLRERELELKAAEARRNIWANPITVAISAGVLALVGNAFVAATNGYLQRQLEETRLVGSLRTEQIKADQALILEAIKANDPEKAATNLAFMVEIGLIADKVRQKSILAYLDKRKPGSGPVLPSSTGAGNSRGSTCDTVQRTQAVQKIDGVEVHFETCSIEKSGYYAYVYNVDNRSTKSVEIIWAEVGFHSWISPGQSMSHVYLDARPPKASDGEISIGRSKVRLQVIKPSNQPKL